MSTGNLLLDSLITNHVGELRVSTVKAVAQDLGVTFNPEDFDEAV